MSVEKQVQDKHRARILTKYSEHFAQAQRNSMIFCTISGLAGFIAFRNYTQILPFRLMGGAAAYVSAQVVH